MFRHEGPGRSVTQNCIVAGYLALVGGFVNCASFVLIGTFTSHVTGNVGRLGYAAAAEQYLTAFDALAMVLAFFAGAFVTSMMTESTFFGRRSNAYALALLTEASLLLFVLARADASLAPTRLATLQAFLLCGAMGMQNSLVTRLSGAVVRTTHLTGVVTDLGIEAARWFRWWRSSLSAKVGVPLAFGKNPAERPVRDRVVLLGTITTSFVLGSAIGAALSLRFSHTAMAFPIGALVVCAAYAYASGRAAARAETPR